MSRYERAAAVLAATVLFFWANPLLACDPGTDVVISEFMAQNVVSLTDGDGITRLIEIYDACAPTVDLTAGT
jgi:hypothetical protein